MNTRFIELAGEINTKMPYYVVQKVSEALNSVGKSIKGSKILILGLAYKKNIGDCRESPSITIIQMLSNKGANVEYSDPYHPRFPSLRQFGFVIKSVPVTKEKLNSFDLVILATDHDDFDLIEKESSIILDTRGKLKNYK